MENIGIAIVFISAALVMAVLELCNAVNSASEASRLERIADLIKKIKDNTADRH